MSMMPTIRALLTAFALLFPAFHSAAAETAFKPAVTRSTAANRIAEKPEYAHAFSSDVS